MLIISMSIYREVKEVAEHQVRHEACEGEQEEEPAESYGEDGRKDCHQEVSGRSE